MLRRLVDCFESSLGGDRAHGALRVPVFTIIVLLSFRGLTLALMRVLHGLNSVETEIRWIAHLRVNVLQLELVLAQVLDHRDRLNLHSLNVAVIQLSESALDVAAELVLHENFVELLQVPVENGRELLLYVARQVRHDSVASSRGHFYNGAGDLVGNLVLGENAVLKHRNFELD